ncbi:MAG TPA: hypothetical protein VLA00_17145 [Xanthobacteraceae bacterium]|nr:hypothetical protein [Xanthobacteraceae bacterium]
MLGVFALAAHPLGRTVLLMLAALAGLGGAYVKGRLDGRALYLARGDRDVLELVERAAQARLRADRRDADDRRLRDDDAFRRN